MYIYDENFYNNFENTSKRAAEIIMPLIIKWLKPKSIIDFGCGEGIWLSVIKQIDENIRILGLDGAYVNEKELKIDKDSFLAVDLSSPVQIEEVYDLAISLEVAEHIDEKDSDIFIDNITKSSDNVLFSAAIPKQGGVHHVNEQWQDYWIHKFEARGYRADVSVRNYFYEIQEITPWRRQNLIFFTRVRKDVLAPVKEIYNIVHPELYLNKMKIVNKRQAVFIGAKEIYCMLDAAIDKALKIERGAENIIIYPFGQNGYICKEILNHKYHIQEKAILDNKLCDTVEGIYSCEYLASLDEDYCVIETCSNKSIRDEIIYELKKYAREKNIVSMLNETPGI